MRPLSFALAAALAFRALTPAQTPALPTLTRQLQAKDAEARRGAAQAIAKLGPDAAPAAPALLRALGDKDAGVAEAAGYALGAIGKKAIPTVRKALGDRARQIPALGAIEKLGPDGAELVPDMLKTLRREELGMREAAAKAARAVGAAAVPHLVAALKDRSISYSVVLIIGDLGPTAKDAAGDLAAVLENRTEMAIVRGSAATSLGQIGVAAAPYLSRMLAVAATDKDTSVRVNVLGAVAILGATEAADRETLQRLTTDDATDVAAAARRALATKPKRGP